MKWRVLAVLAVVSVLSFATNLVAGGTPATAGAPGKSNFAKGIVQSVDNAGKVLVMKVLAGKVDGKPPAGIKSNNLKDIVISVSWDDSTRVSGTIVVNAIAYVIFAAVPDGKNSIPKYDVSKKSFHAQVIEVKDATFQGDLEVGEGGSDGGKNPDAK